MAAVQNLPIRSDVASALRKGLAVLGFLAADGSLTRAEIQRAAALNMPMASRVARVLRETGYVRCDSVRRRDSLAFKPLKLGAARIDIIASQPTASRRLGSDAIPIANGRCSSRP